MPAGVPGAATEVCGVICGVTCGVIWLAAVTVIPGVPVCGMAGSAARVENEQAWRVSIDQIKAANYNLDLKNPHNPDTGPGDVDHLLPEYEKLLGQIAGTRAKLKQELHHALSATAGTTA